MQKKKGISLIVLVITIIVMIILAAAIILSLNNAGIIGNANKAVEMTNDAQVQTAADLAYAEYLIDNSVVGEGSTLESWLNEKVNYDGYKVYVVDEEPVVVKEGSLADKFYKGDIKVGDYINYKAAEVERVFETKDYYFESSSKPSVDREIQIKVTPDIKWRVMGVDKNTKELLITTADVVSVIEKSSGEESRLYLSGFYGYVYGGDLLESICSEFGKGTYATKGRSMTADDITDIIDYDKTTYVYSDDYNTIKYGTAQHFDGKEYKIITTPKQNLDGNYIFNVDRLTESETISKTIKYTGYHILAESIKDAEPLEYNLIFRNADNTEFVQYWLNSQCIRGGTYPDYDCITYNMMAIGLNTADEAMLGTKSSLNCFENTMTPQRSRYYMRPVIHISESANATKDANDIWVLQ